MSLKESWLPSDRSMRIFCLSPPSPLVSFICFEPSFFIIIIIDVTVSPFNVTNLLSLNLNTWCVGQVLVPKNSS